MVARRNRKSEGIKRFRGPIMPPVGRTQEFRKHFASKSQVPASSLGVSPGHPPGGRNGEVDAQHRDMNVCREFH
ncbi:hypothetical protein A5661_10755 [Mycobacterium asiaticum]|nr:hypothetical protein A5661_10755 [Mycobacterium asiaticum]